MSEQNINVGILGAAGRMGQALIAALNGFDRLVFAAAADHSGHPGIGQTVAGSTVILSADPAALFAASDVVVDFTPPGNTAAHAGLAAESGVSYVVGTTGLSDSDHSALDDAATRISLVQAGNYSLGINMLQLVTRLVAEKLGDDWDIDITDAHHRHKIDAPSGTALMLGEAAAAGRGVNFDDVRAPERFGVGEERKKGDIGFSAVRAGSIIGEHDVIFASDEERLILSHKAENRGLFAKGALVAAEWVVGQAPGRYDMTDVLGGL